MKIIGNEDLYLNPTFKALTDVIILRNAARETNSDGNIVATVENDHPKINVLTCLAWLQAGGEVEELPLFIELTAAKYAADVLVGIPNRSVTDENGNETVLKWSEWKRETNTHQEISGKFYIMTNANISPAYLKASEFAVIYGKAGYNLLTNAEYAALLPQA